MKTKLFITKKDLNQGESYLNKAKLPDKWIQPYLPAIHRVSRDEWTKFRNLFYMWIKLKIVLK